MKETISVYPNPASEVLFVQNSQGAEISILNMFGKVMTKSTSNELNLNHLSPGSYFVNVNGSQSKFIKL
jgi:hypothetical protein